MSDTQYGFSTRAITAGQHFDPTTGAVVPPVYMTSTFVQDGIGGFRGGYEYARSANPTRDSLQELIASIEGADVAYSFASGLAAEDTLWPPCLIGPYRLVQQGGAGGVGEPLLEGRHAVECGR